MKKRKNAKRQPGMRREYDFRHGTRGKHAGHYAAGTNVVVLDPDVAKEFPTADVVNETLRAVSKLLQGRKNRISKRRSA